VPSGTLDGRDDVLKVADGREARAWTSLRCGRAARAASLYVGLGSALAALEHEVYDPVAADRGTEHLKAASRVQQVRASLQRCGWRTSALAGLVLATECSGRTMSASPEITSVEAATASDIRVGPALRTLRQGMRQPPSLGVER
jgi:hypothetical protein